MAARGFAGSITLLVLVALLASCDVDVNLDLGVRGSGELTTESRDVSDFDEIVVLGSGDVIVEVTGAESLTVEAEDNIMPLLTTEVRNGRLELGSTASFSTTRAITYTIEASALTGVEIDGSGDVTASGLDSDMFEVTINGSGNVVPTGSVGDVSVEINGSGAYEGAELVASVGSVEVSGSGSVLVNARDELDVRISGSGEVTYVGSPTLTEDISGSGSISRAE